MEICLPHELNHCPSMVPKQCRVPITNMLQAMTLKDKVVFIARLANVADVAEPL